MTNAAQLFDVGLPPINEDEPRSHVLAVTSWPTNAELIFDCARLGYLGKDRRTLDATYGEGKWWTIWRPDELVTNDINPDKPAEHHHDFRKLPWPDGEFDDATFDPPYISPGGLPTSGNVDDYHYRYGLTPVTGDPASLQTMIDDGLREVARVVRPKGFILAKCMNYITSGKLVPGVFDTWRSGAEAGLDLFDVLHHLSGTGPQPKGRQQVHARSNYSTLLVFRKAR